HGFQTTRGGRRATLPGSGQDRYVPRNAAEGRPCPRLGRRRPIHSIKKEMPLGCGSWLTTASTEDVSGAERAGLFVIAHVKPFRSGDGFAQWDGGNVVAFERSHLTEFALEHEFAGPDAKARGQYAVIGARGAAALQVAERYVARLDP